MKPLYVTVITKSYRKVGRKAVQLVKKNTGLEVLVLEGEDSEGFFLKLNLDKLCGRRPIIFGDADLWPIRKTNFDSLIPKHGFFAVHDSAVTNPLAFPKVDCDENGLRHDLYANTGFFACDLRDPLTRKVFQNARKYYKQCKSGKLRTADTTEQFALNKAMLDVPIHLLPVTLNFYYKAVLWGQLPFIPRDIINLHAAGVPAGSKYQELCDQMKVFGQESGPMQDDAILATYSRNYQLM